MKKENVKLFISSILAGFAFAIGSAMYLHYSSESVLSAAVIFSGAFLTIKAFKLNLFTCKAGYLFYTKENYDKNLSSLIISFLGNLIGVAAIAGMLIGSPIAEAAEVFMSAKSPIFFPTALAMSFICGMLMFVASHGYKRLNGGFSGCFILTFTSVVFLILGGEHALLNAFCSIITTEFTAESGLHFLFSLIGNIFGAIIFAELYLLQKKERDEN